MRDLIKFDFGSEFVLPEQGYVKPLRYFSNTRYMWVTEPLAKWELGEKAPYIDYAWQYRGEFRIGLKPGKYSFKFLFYHWNEEKQEFGVRLEKTKPNSPVMKGEILREFLVQAEKKEKKEYEIELDFAGGILAIVFPETFFINALEIVCDENGDLMSMYHEPIKEILPSIEEVAEKENVNPKEALASYCDYLVAMKTPEGFIGDYWTSISDEQDKIDRGIHEGSTKLWYTVAYVVRTLLMGYHFIGKKSWLDSSIELIDRFVSEQLPDGSFTQVCRDEPTANLSPERLEEVCNSWRNLADVGSMVAALLSGVKFVDSEQGQKYIAVAEKYFSEWALKFRQASGGFTNGWTGGPAKLIYGVSTASSALSMALLSKLTNNREYMVYAEEAALFLAKNWNEDGRYMHWPYDNEFPGHEYYQDTTFFADSFYVLEAVSAVLNLSDNYEVRKILFDGLEKYLFGTVGLLKKKEGLSWLMSFR